MKIFFILCTLTFILFARENPFAPIQNQKPKPITPISDNIPPLINKPKIKTIAKDIKIKDDQTDKIKMKQTWRKCAKVKKLIKKPKVTHQKTKKIVKKPHKRATKVIYKNRFSTIKQSGNSIMIITKDKLLKDFIKQGEKQLILDFERFDVVAQSSKKIYSRYIKKLVVGYHGYYYRYIFFIKNRGNYTVKKTKYGYKINLYR